VRTQVETSTFAPQPARVLYEIELSVACSDLPGLDAGVYHFNPADVSLRLLRKGDFRGNLAQATAMEPAVAHAPVTIICTGTYWRHEELSLLLGGIDLAKTKHKRWYRKALPEGHAAA
jgi:hypothetical protein